MIPPDQTDSEAFAEFAFITGKLRGMLMRPGIKKELANRQYDPDVLMRCLDDLAKHFYGPT